jgi:peptide/nickel transport system ATP-binding protein
MSLLAIEGLRATIGGRAVLDHVSIHVAAGETVGLVGESGSGKSLTSLAAIGMLPGVVRVAGGTIQCCGVDVRGANRTALRALRGAKAALIFQDPLQALMPTRRVGQQLADVLAAHRAITGVAARRIGTDLFAAMGLADPDRIWRARPFELSGGQRQRALIAIALCVDPSLVIADEVTTALDADARADVLALIAAHVRKAGAGALIVSHDLGLIRGACDRVYVMHMGRVVEHGSAEQIIERPTDSYTRMLLAALPDRSEPKTMLPVTEL